MSARLLATCRVMLPLLCGLLGGLLLWLAQPTVSWWPLAWAAPMPYLWLATRAELSVFRPYRQLWVASTLYWLAALYWIPMAHPVQYASWVALSMYLGIYLPLFVRVVRMAKANWGLPIWCAAPVAAVACEYAMAHLLTGIAMATPTASQVHWITILQCIDIAGPYTLTFLVMLVAAAVVGAFDIRLSRLVRGGGVAVAAFAMVAAIVYGQWRSNIPASDVTPLRVAIVQGNERAVWVADADRDARVMRQYFDLSRQAINDAKVLGQKIDVIVWPENMFRSYVQTVPDPETLGDPDQVLQQINWDNLAGLRKLAQESRANLIVGTDHVHWLSADRTVPTSDQYKQFNSAAIISYDGRLIGIYDKQHLVVCGEYIPLVDWFPALYRYTPMPAGLGAGEEPIAPLVDGTRMAPNICYESVLPHVIRRQVAKLRSRGERPELLVNLTNDSWFGSSCELDMHLACNILRAVENRTPTIVAANGGLSAAIDRTGRLLAVSGKQTAEVLMVDVTPGAATSLYLTIGDWPAIVCTVACLVLLAIPLVQRLAKRSAKPSQTA